MTKQKNLMDRKIALLERLKTLSHPLQNNKNFSSSRETSVAVGVPSVLIANEPAERRREAGEAAAL